MLQRKNVISRKTNRFPTMKKLLFLLIILCSQLSTAQEWKTVPADYCHGFFPYNQFSVNPYTNQLWFANGWEGAVIEPDGTIVKFGEEKIGTLWVHSLLRFGFTPDHLFYIKAQAGLHLFDNYESVLIEPSEFDITTIRNDGDTLFMRRSSAPLLKYTYPILSEQIMVGGSDAISKNGHFYMNAGPFAYVVNNTNTFFFESEFYLQAPSTTFQFQNYTDTIYLGFTKGISKAYAGECFDTITPHNTVNMPSGNVLEIEFDKNDELWVAFGDEEDNHIALAHLVGDTWTDIFTPENSPLDFSRFYGFEFDTLGNLWVATGNQLHTLLTPDSPAWLSTKEIEQPHISVSVFPNPAQKQFTLSAPELKITTTAYLFDLSGRKVRTYSNISDQSLLNVEGLSKGVYTLRLATVAHPGIKVVVE